MISFMNDIKEIFFPLSSFLKLSNVITVVYISGILFQGDGVWEQWSKRQEN